MKTEVVSFINTSLEITYLIGEYADDNFGILNKACDDDIWFHANNISSCHIIATNLPELTKKEKQKVIKRGAFLCKQNTSKLKSLQNVEIIYTKVKNVTKTDISGTVNITNEKKIVI
jgi:predicted ribosome quality control (RQC) complex YloA/Tae2 family protein